MPRHFVNRPRAFNILLRGDPLDLSTRHRHLTWEWFSAYLYVAGCLLLLAGSILSLTSYNTDGFSLFIVATSFFLAVSIHDLAEIANYTNHATTTIKQPEDARLERAAGATFLMGSISFVTGRILLLPSIGQEYAAALVFIGGSCFYLIGIGIDAVQTYESPDKRSLQYANLEAMLFVAGSVVYICASVPFLYSQPEYPMFEIMSIFYIIGSMLFMFGGLMNILRLLAVHETHVRQTETAPLNQTKEYSDSEDDSDNLLGESESMIVSESIMIGKLKEKTLSAEDLVFGESGEAHSSMELSIHDTKEIFTA